MGMRHVLRFRREVAVATAAAAAAAATATAREGASTTERGDCHRWGC